MEVLMKRTGWQARWAAIAAASLAAAAVCGPVAAASATPAPGPEIKMVAAQNNITVPGEGKLVEELNELTNPKPIINPGQTAEAAAWRI